MIISLLEELRKKLLAIWDYKYFVPTGLKRPIAHQATQPTGNSGASYSRFTIHCFTNCK